MTEKKFPLSRTFQGGLFYNTQPVKGVTDMLIEIHFTMILRLLCSIVSKPVKEKSQSTYLEAVTFSMSVDKCFKSKDFVASCLEETLP